MRGETRVIFDQPFEYVDKDAGTTETNEITIRPPSIAHYHIHSKMEAWMGEAMRGMAAMQSSLGQTSPPVPPTPSNGAASSLDEDDDEQDPMQVMQMGLSIDTYPEFVSYVKDVLTNEPALAFIGDARSPIRDVVWLNLAEVHGLDGVGRVIGTFTSFFLEALLDEPKQKKSGSASSLISSSSTKVASATPKRASSRTKS